MPAAVLTAEARAETGKRQMRRLRAAGKVPAVLCERGQPSLNLAVGREPLRRVLTGGTPLVELDLGGQRKTALVRQVQWDPLGETLLHVDFQKISLAEKVEVEVEVVLKGKPLGVTEDKGLLIAHHRTLKVSCLPAAIPATLPLDVGGLRINGVMHASDVTLPEGVALVSDPSTVVCAVAAPKTEEQVTAETAAPVAPVSTEPELIRKERKEAEPAEEEAGA